LPALWRGVPWVPVWRRDLKRIDEYLRPKTGKLFVELGCGDGRALVFFAERGLKAVGYELSPLPFFAGWLRSFFHKNMKIYLRNLWNISLRDADIIYIFLMPNLYEKLGEKLKQEGKNGARVISYVWPIKAMEADYVSKEINRPNIYFYTIRK